MDCSYEGCDKPRAGRGLLCGAHKYRKSIGQIDRDPKAGLVASRSATTRELEWAAGFLEGEGHFGGSLVRGKYPTQLVSAAQVNSEPLAKLRSFLGGRITFTEKRKPNQSDFFTWTVNGVRARGVMLTLYPLLSEKRQKQIEEALVIALFPDDIQLILKEG